MNGATIPRGSYTELTMDSIPLLVAGLSLITMLKPNVSDDTFHCTPSALSTGSLSKSSPFTFVALSDSGKDLSILLEFNNDLVSLNPPLARSSRNWSARVTPASSVGTDFKQSSTY